ncbi:MAG TPA: phosphoribosylformylglycinamidine cyclo-ligase, partial [Thermomicrobiales bacterium]|nr:phosphoribosylformylglycinamidine cyclo-ligase [Thermomicrobiales bacterium]
MAGREGMSYAAAGVDIAAADAAKAAMAASLETADRRVLNRIGAFATLFDASFPGYEQPVLVMKTEEPGSKQKLALQYDRVESLCEDLVNHLINDIIVMGAKPLSVQDAIICGQLDGAIVNRIVAGLAAACRAQGCMLTGGETSEQPGVLDAGTYILVANAVGVVERAKIVDGSRIAAGDVVLAVASNGLHTNGYSLVRALLVREPALAAVDVAGEPFLDVILRPHRCYYQPVRGLFDRLELHGMAHITGGGIEGNLRRIVSDGLHARIDLGAIAPPPVFRVIHEHGGVDDADMLRTFNLGVGLALVVAPGAVDGVRQHLAGWDCACWPIGVIEAGGESGKVVFAGTLGWE